MVARVPESQPGSRRVLAVVSSFRPTAELVGNVALIAAQVDGVVVVDDGSGPDHAGVLDDVRALGATVVVLPENVGIAAALNAGLEAAAPADVDLVVTFDQDSVLPDGFVAALVEVWDRGVAAGLPVGMVSPAQFAGVAQVAGGVDPDGFQRSREPIQSGSLVSGEVLRTCGLMRAELFIDLVDVEYWLRLTTAGRACLAAPGLDLPHSLGRTYPLRLGPWVPRVGGAALTLSMSTPFRYYYRARNRVVINRAYQGVATGLRVVDTLKELRHLVFVLAYARPRGAMARIIARGLRDGARGVGGRIPDDLARRAAAISWRIDPL
ncbi:glycosyl transferase family 2 [Xylanimonas cellulosilytica DSM 15894]|uniref:Glycosyl transferase family 2 n=1 Tax=Xylanimonas cellulosilytica (strain DSM 15894 / JCM 12276 / CECT 5975 / KCTC 9989 / LMG 20990 / NBRC 107835 / XIL07) TaxID=446471 RepID=D1BX12_XYLCX|nr:glycosyltransferase [Xylanimonas cellulosilytica]ACZ31580.1 glycosyl transferase family 2 [Xylanimonas cellulosilytica DSM 15894]